jgi:hypothetical protein
MNKYFVCIEFQSYSMLDKKITIGKTSSIVKAETIEQAIENLKSLLPKNTKQAIVTCATFIEHDNIIQLEEPQH